MILVTIAAGVLAVDYPLLVISGTADEVVPNACCAAFVSAARTADKQLTTVEGATHNTLCSEGRTQQKVSGEQLAASVFAWLASPSRLGSC